MNRRGLLGVVLLLGLVMLPPASVAENLVTVCSQNLARYGEKGRRQSDADREKQLNYLTGRMRRANCDVIAVQEVVGESKAEAAGLLQAFAQSLSQRTQRSFVSIVGDGRDKFIRNGFLVDHKLFKIIEVVSYGDKALPRYRALAPPNFFERAPLGIRIQLTKETAASTQLFLINNHFKSKAFSHKDPTGLSFELIRMQEAEAVRRIIEQELSPDQQRAVLIVLGDRNSGIDSASTAIIEGEYLLKDFMSESCKVEKEGTPNCKHDPSAQPLLVGLFGYRQQQFPGQFRGGSYRYRGREEYLDEIFLRSAEINRVLDAKRRVRIGTEGDYFRGSDHKLVWADLSLD